VKGTSSPTIVGVRKLECFAISQGRPSDPILIRLGIVPARVRQTDRRLCRSYYALSTMCCRA